MGKDFNFGQWAGGVDRVVRELDRRLRLIEDGADARLSDQSLGPNERRGLSQLVESMGREHAALKKAVEAVHTHGAEVGRTTLNVVGNIEQDTSRLRQELQALMLRFRELAWHVGVYDESVQGIAIRPQRAVPALVKDWKTGSSYANPVKVHTKTFWLASTSRTVTIPANGQARVVFLVPPEENLEGDMEIYALELASSTSSSFRVQLSHTGLGGQYLSNVPVHALSTFGNMSRGTQPFELYETIFLQPGQELDIDLYDFSGSDNTVEIVAHGRRFIGYATSGMDRRGLINTFARNVWPYWLTTDQVLLLNAAGVNNGVTQTTFTVNRAFHFEAARAMQFGSISGLPAPVPFHIQLNEGQSGRLIADQTPYDCFGGDGNFPFPLFEPYLALRGTQLNGQVVNDNGFAGQTVDIVLHGRALPVSFPNQHTLEPVLEGRSIQLPPSQKDLTIQQMVSM